jgi:hypothetical protein
MHLCQTRRSPPPKEAYLWKLRKLAGIASSVV